MILKAGTYRWNDYLGDLSLENSGGDYDIVFSTNYSIVTDDLNLDFVANCTGVAISNKAPFPEIFTVVGYVIDNTTPDINPLVQQYFGETLPIELLTYEKDTWEYLGINDQSFTIPYDQDVDSWFGEYFIANTNYNEVNKSSLVTIEYNGSTIAELNAGETATLSCNGFAMASDVVVKIGEMQSDPNKPNVTDLSGTQWLVKSGWRADAGYGEFTVNFTILQYMGGGGLSQGGPTELNIGYAEGSNHTYTPTADTIGFPSSGRNFVIDNSYPLTFSFRAEAGTDATNTKLIEWLTKYGEMFA